MSQRRGPSASKTDPSVEKVSDLTAAVFRLRFRTSLLPAKSQSCAPSPPPISRLRPSGENSTLSGDISRYWTRYARVGRSESTFPDVVSHTMTRLLLPVATLLPSCENATAFTTE